MELILWHSNFKLWIDEILWNGSLDIFSRENQISIQVYEGFKLSKADSKGHRYWTENASVSIQTPLKESLLKIRW